MCDVGVENLSVVEGSFAVITSKGIEVLKEKPGKNGSGGVVTLPMLLPCRRS
jgi:hypothetical protein